MLHARDLTFLKDVFLNAELAQIGRELLEPVLLVHPALGSGRLKDAPRIQVLTGGVGNGTVSGAVVPAGKLFIVPYVHAGHDDATARQTRLTLVGPDGASLFTISSSPGAMASGTRLSNPRTLYVPQGCTLETEVDAIAAGAHALLNILSWEVPVGELIDIP